jgi:hypothetical protein
VSTLDQNLDSHLDTAQRSLGIDKGSPRASEDLGQNIGS